MKIGATTLVAWALAMLPFTPGSARADAVSGVGVVRMVEFLGATTSATIILSSNGADVSLGCGNSYNGSVGMLNTTRMSADSMKAVLSLVMTSYLTSRPIKLYSVSNAPSGGCLITGASLW